MYSLKTDINSWFIIPIRILNLGHIDSTCITSCPLEPGILVRHRSMGYSDWSLSNQWSTIKPMCPWHRKQPERQSCKLNKRIDYSSQHNQCSVGGVARTYYVMRPTITDMNFSCRLKMWQECNCQQKSGNYFQLTIDRPVRCVFYRLEVVQASF